MTVEEENKRVEECPQEAWRLVRRELRVVRSMIVVGLLLSLLNLAGVMALYVDESKGYNSLVENGKVILVIGLTLAASFVGFFLIVLSIVKFFKK